MVYTAQVKNGVVVFDNGSPPEGAKLLIEIADTPSTPESQPATGEQTDNQRPAIWDKLLKLAGTIEGPTDWAENHDHYRHGTPKRKRP